MRQTGLGAQDLAVALVMNLLWGLNIVAVKMAVGTTQPFTAASLRLWIVFLACWPFLRIVPGQMRLLLLLGVLSGAVFLGIINLSVLVSNNLPSLAIAGQLGVPFSLILAVLFLGERVALARVGGILLTFAGVLLLLFDPGIVNEAAGLGLTVIASLIWAVSSLLLRRLQGVSVPTLFAWIGLIGALTLSPVAWLVEPEAVATLPDMRLGDLGWIAFSAIGSSLIGHGGMAWLLQRHPVSLVAPLTLLAPIVSVIVASLVFGTVLTPVMIAGGVIAMAGVAIITMHSARTADTADTAA